MTAYVYLKNTPKKPFLRNLTRKRLSYIFLAVGVFFFIFAIFPIVQFQIEYSSKFDQVLNPLSTRFYNNRGNVLGSLTTDYTQLNNWFVDDKKQTKTLIPQSPSNLTTYTLSIPKLKIKDAVVTLGSMDLKKSLIQYPQTALPGQLGNPVIFGHSVLPQFFSAKSYTTIFATLFRLQPSDEILINFDHVDYKYVVDEMYEVQPNDLSVLEQRFDDHYLTIITCSPPGTVLRRLVVKAKIVDNH